MTQRAVIRTSCVIVTAGLLATLAFVPSARAQDQVTTLTQGQLTICLYPGFPPVVSMGGDGQWQGWDVAFMQDFAASLDLVFEPVTVETFDGIWLLPGEDRCDIAAAAITVTTPRQQNSPGTVWSDPYYTTFRAFLVRAGDQAALQGAADLEGRRVLVNEGSTADLDLQRRIAQDNVANVTIDYATSDEMAVQQVLDEEAFAFGAGQVRVDYLGSIHTGLATAWPHPYLQADGSTQEENYAYVVRTASAGLVEALNAYIAANGDHYGQDGG